MKQFLLFTVFLLIATFSFSQDTIVRTNGNRIATKVIEITSSTIKYKKYSQLDGPIRALLISTVERIIYYDGTEEVFVEKKPLPKEFLFKNGFYIDFSIGIAENINTYTTSIGFPPYYHDSRTNFISTNIKLGNKWYFGSKPRWRPGIQFQYIRFGLNFTPDIEYFIEDLFVGPKNFSILNVGMANVFKISDKIGIEANFVGGFNVHYDIDGNGMHEGVCISPEIKLRINHFSLGFDYQYIFVFDRYIHSQWNTLSLNLGLKL